MNGEYIDIIDSKDWIISQIVYRTQKLLNRAKKVPYDNTGIAMLEAECLTVLKEAAAMGMIAFATDAERYLYSVNYALREKQTDADRVARRYVGGSFEFELAGAIHSQSKRRNINIERGNLKWQISHFDSKDLVVTVNGVCITGIGEDGVTAKG